MMSKVFLSFFPQPLIGGNQPHRPDFEEEKEGDITRVGRLHGPHLAKLL